MNKHELKLTLLPILNDMDDDELITVWNILFEDDHIYSMDDFNAIFYDYTPLDMMDIVQDYFCSSDDYFWYNSDGEITSGDFRYTPFNKDFVINEISENIHQPYLKNFAEYGGLEKLNELVNQYLLEEKL